MPSSIEKISIALPPEMIALVRKAVETGEYASSSEVVRDALRDWTYKRQLQQRGIEELRQLWKDARADNTPGIDAHEVLDRLERKYQAIAEGSLLDRQNRSTKSRKVLDSIVLPQRAR